jgi:type II secretory pathway predicted ATPase ExeA/cell division septation protein DedD
MYNKFFGFKEQPFRLAPDPNYLFLSKNHEEVLTHLIFAISQGKDSVRLTGKFGIGKTTLCRAFFNNLDEHIRAVYITSPKPDALQFLKAINDAFLVDSTPDKTEKDLIDGLNEFLIVKKEAGQKALLLIDEAHELSAEALEQLDRLSKLGNSQGKLLQIILAGEPELAGILSSSSAGQLGKSFAKKYNLAPLTLLETEDYIRHRISVVAHKTGPPFNKAACRAIHDYSGGIPKLINIVCEIALQIAFNRKIFKITESITREAINTLTQGKKDKPIERPRKFPGLAVFAAILIPLVIVLLYYTKGQFMDTPVIGESADKVKIQATTGPSGFQADKPGPSEKPEAIDQSGQGEIISAGRSTAPAKPEPIDSPERKPGVSEKPPADRQNETAENISKSDPAYSVHAGTFQAAAQANQLINNLKSLGFPSFGYTSLNKKGNIVHVVVAGKYESLDRAKEASRSLSKQGYSNFIAAAKDSLRIPAGSAPVEHSMSKQEIPATPLTGNQDQTGETKPESLPVYSVHAGSFQTASQANQLLDALKSLSFPSFMYTSKSKKGNTVYVVVAGKYQSIDLAKEAGRRLTENGHSNFISRAKESFAHGPGT